MESRSSNDSAHLQLDFIDGLRAFAALYIVLHHALQTSAYLPWWLTPFSYGYGVVVMFITISGFCLSLPMAKRGQWTLNIRSFYWKRARRIFPPYYAALFIGFLIIFLYGIRTVRQDYIGTPFNWAMVWSHVALIQNWMPFQLVSVDGPLWSIAVECQIYLLFPLLVILRNRAGRWGALVLSLLAVRALLILVHYQGFTNLLFVFVIGMLGADLAFHPASRRCLIPGIFLGGVGAFFTYGRHMTIAEYCIGLTTAFLMSYLTQVRGSIGNRILGWKPLAWIGTFSYSLYLIHSYIEILGARWMAHSKLWTNATPAQQAVVLVLFVSPLALLASYGFYLVFEQPFTSNSRRRAEERLAPHPASGSITPAI